jgi:hypothetical protein
MVQHVQIIAHKQDQGEKSHIIISTDAKKDFKKT